MAKAIMIQGTMSGVGKSLVTSGLLRVFKQDGYKVAPFKAQNMALNSYITEEGLEIGRAQAVQAQAAGVKPSVYMNPILLKPNSDTGSQVIVKGVPIGNMSAKAYFEYKKELKPIIADAFNKLSSEYDIIVIEGAGSPAEINLKENDIVNMGMAEIADCPVILVGDIDRGGVFAQLCGTVQLLSPSERDRIKGLVINKFRGDKSILEKGLAMLEGKCSKKIVGVLPYIHADIDDEDSLSERFKASSSSPMDIAVIRLPRISNFTDFIPLEKYGLRYVDSPHILGKPHVVIIPGTKNTLSDMKWLREKGFEPAIQRLAHSGTIVMGICGGYQMLGNEIREDKDSIRGMGLLPVCTAMSEEKTRKQVRGKILWKPLEGAEFEGYEIHHGVTEGGTPFDNMGGAVSDNILGTYIHGIFDEGDFCQRFIDYICNINGIDMNVLSQSRREYREKQYDILADMIRQNMDMSKIYEILENRPSEEIKHVLPADIEKTSMEIIEKELIANIPEENKDIVKRAIHTTADFDYAENLYFSENAVRLGREAIRRGASIITDTNMARAGINKKRLAKYGGSVLCFMADEDIAKKADKNGTTRAAASMERAAELEGEYIIAIGNAPTALIKLKELIDEGRIRPALVIAAPVGFVNAAESKELIMKCNIPLIAARGRKGGSNLAAALCNALIYGA